MTKPQANTTVDVIIGRRIRARRMQLGLSAEELGKAVNISGKQICKYENADNKTSAALLWRLAQALETSVNYFFDGLPKEVAAMK